MFADDELKVKVTLPLPLTLAGLTETVRPPGDDDAVTATVPEKPLTADTVIVVVFVVLETNVTLVGLAATEKSCTI